MFHKIFIIFFINLINLNVLADNNRIIIASTTSAYDSGLVDYINKEFEKKFNIYVHVLALGTGQAIRIAKNGDADVLLVHDTLEEKKFIKEGYGKTRHDLMYNDYVIVGPKTDNEKCDSIKETLLKIMNNKLIFISRGDESGTHKKEKDLWNLIKYKTDESDSWYKKVGQGMGSTLILANELYAYTLSDRGTWISMNKKENLKIICENLPPLLNQYGIIGVNQKINSRINSKNANKYVNWIISDEGKKLINGFRVNNEQLFFFNHH
jgi:tungstate transport system substrate-binding protein